MTTFPTEVCPATHPTTPPASLTPHAPSTPIGNLTEAELIARVQRKLPPRPDWMLVGIGDDAAVVEPERNRVEVVTVDALIEGVHFDRAFVPPDAIGHRALAVNLSDLAAMGASARLALLSMALPPTLLLDDFERLVAGFVSLASRYQLHLAGGNLARSPGPLMLDVTVIGTVKRRQALTRSGARPGDELYVSGTLGAATAGLQMLRTRGSSGSSEVANDCVERYLRPEPRLRFGTLVARNRAAVAAVDLSDGLADGVQQLAQASGVGIVVDCDALPIAPATRRWFEAQGLDPAHEAMTGGDDYELLVAVRPRSLRRFRAAVGRAKISFTRVGVCTEEPDVLMRRQHDGQISESPLPRAAYSHFR